MHMPRKMIDISVPLENDVARRSAGLRAIDRISQTHKHTAADICKFFPGLERKGPARRRRLGDRMDQALDPLHHAPRCALAFRLDHGSAASARSPSTRCRSNGASSRAIKLDFRHLPGRPCRQRQQMSKPSSSASATSSPRSRSWCVNTSARRGLWAARITSPNGCGMGREATLYLLERGVRVTGTDGWSMGRAVRLHQGEIRSPASDRSLIWEGHEPAARSAIATSRSCTISRRFPPRSFTVSCFPVKVRGGSAGWTRAVAIIDSDSR